MSKQKTKGRKFEHLVADTLTDNGIPSKRVPMSGQLRDLDASLDGDVVILATGEKIECKNRQSIAKRFWEWLDGNTYLCIKRNNMQPLILMTMDEFIKLKKLP